MMRVFILLSFLLFSLVSQADVSGELDDWFDAQYSNVTPAGVYEGQKTTSVTMGGYSSRTPVKKIGFNLGIDVQTPKFSAGCGGIDLYAGGFSGVNADEFVSNLRAIGQNAQSLAFMLALQSVSPTLQGVMNEIKASAEHLKGLNFDSCQAASELVGGVHQQFGTEKSNCISTRMDDYGEDYTEASWACTNGGQKAATEGGNGGQDANKISFTRGNLVWYAMMGNGYLRDNPEFSQLIMNLLGTVIYEPASGAADAGKKVVRISSKFAPDGQITGEGEEILSTLIHDDDNNPIELELFQCDSTTLSTPGERMDCTDGDYAMVDVDWDPLETRVNDLIEGIASKVQNDTDLTQEEIRIIEAAGFPVYRYITSYIAASNSTAAPEQVAQELSKFNELIAATVVYNNISEVMSTVMKEVENLPDAISNSEEIRTYIGSLRSAQSAVSTQIAINRISTKDYLESLELMVQYERTMMAKLGTNFFKKIKQ